MGGLQTKYFLQRQTAQWKAQFIKRWIPISAPWIGAAKEWRLFATGDPDTLPVSAGTIRDEQRSSETNAWMLPLVGGEAGFNDTVFVTTPGRNYTVNDYDSFFDDIGYAVGKLVRPRVHSLMSPFTAPGVPVHCLYSTGVPTPFSFTYVKESLNIQCSDSYLH
jgi:lysophospholipase-3